MKTLKIFIKVPLLLSVYMQYRTIIVKICEKKCSEFEARNDYWLLGSCPYLAAGPDYLGLLSWKLTDNKCYQ